MDPLDSFRLDTRDWLEQNCPDAMRFAPSGDVMTDADVCWGGRNCVFSCDEQRVWLMRMAERGWTAPTWPREYGGGGLDRAQAKVLAEELQRIRAHNPLDSFGISMLGPALLKYGTHEQKAQFLPPIVRGEIRWCQGYSEPNAGSDLAGLQTRAEDMGDHFLVNGQKVWTSYADKADWIFCLVRTDFAAPKHQGISFVLFDMQSPGVSTRPIRLISGASPFCETFFDNVRVETRNLVGTLNAGWDVAKYLLTHERDMIGAMGEISSTPSVSEAAKSTVGLDALGRLSEFHLRSQIAEFELDEAAFRLTLQRVGDMAKARLAHPAMSSMLKYYGSELNKRRWELMASTGGSDALEWESKRSDQGQTARTWLRTKGNSIEGGTSEVQLNVIAKRILELPGV
jgi:alkylation response protein AidB-like acyl-CoA dehydrogenase